VFPNTLDEEEGQAHSMVEFPELDMQDDATSSHPTLINTAMVMPTPQGKGGDPPQEGEDKRQTPMELPEQSPSPPTTPSRPHPSRLSFRIPGWKIPPKVLLVDDDIVCRRLSSRFLRIFGCFIDVAVDGVGAVNKMNLEKYDLVLMVGSMLAFIVNTSNSHIRTSSCRTWTEFLQHRSFANSITGHR
jgi:CheY-like chemotaxis protein